VGIPHGGEATARNCFFNSPDRKLMAVDVKPGASFEAGVPRPYLKFPALSTHGRFVASLDGERFLMPIQFSG
jgi:hypothetical protein